MSPQIVECKIFAPCKLYVTNIQQSIQFSLQIEKDETAEEKTNYNFRRANFDAMRADLDELLNVSSSIVMPHRDLNSSRIEYINLVGDTYPRNASSSITHHGSTMMSRSSS